MLLEIENLTKRFGELIAVNNFSFNIEKGDILGLIGPNGAGKTTVFNLITGILKPDGGLIRFKGKEITGLKVHQIVERGISRTFQIVRPLANLSVFENVYIGCFSKKKHRESFLFDQSNGRKERITEILKLAGLLGQEEVTAGKLPYGNLKRLEIARAVATEPELLLLDEPFGGLNYEEITGLTSLIQMLNEKGFTIVIVEHKLRPLMKISKRVVAMHFGKKIAEGIPEEIGRNEEVIDIYLGAKIDVGRK